MINWNKSVVNQFIYVVEGNNMVNIFLFEFLEGVLNFKIYNKIKIIWCLSGKISLISFLTSGLWLWLCLCIFISLFHVSTEYGSLRVILLKLHNFLQPFLFNKNPQCPTESNFHNISLKVIISESKIKVRFRIFLNTGNKIFL